MGDYIFNRLFSISVSCMGQYLPPCMSHRFSLSGLRSDSCRIMPSDLSFPQGLGNTALDLSLSHLDSCRCLEAVSERYENRKTAENGGLYPAPVYAAVLCA